MIVESSSIAMSTQELILPPEVLSKVLIKTNQKTSIAKNLMRTNKLMCLQVENALMYMIKRGIITEPKAPIEGEVVDQDAIDLYRLVEWVFSWYLYQWVLIKDEQEFNEFYVNHKHFLDYFLNNIMKWKSGSENVNPRVKLALTSFQKLTTKKETKDAIVVTSVETNVKQEHGAPKRAKVFARAGIERVKNEFMLQVMHIKLLDDKESHGTINKSVRLLRVFQRVNLAREQQLANQTPIKRYTIEHGGMGGHWGDDQGQLLDIAQSISLNKYLNTHPDFDWLPPFIMRSTEMIAECMHDIDCSIDDQRISDPKKFKEEFLKKFAGLVVVTNKLKK